LIDEALKSSSGDAKDQMQMLSILILWMWKHPFNDGYVGLNEDACA